MALTFYELSEEEARRLAGYLLAHWTKNRLTRTLRQWEHKPRACGFPLHRFFRKSFLEEEAYHPDRELIGTVIAEITLRTGRSTQWACQRIMHDVLNGLILLGRTAHGTTHILPDDSTGRDHL